MPTLSLNRWSILAVFVALTSGGLAQEDPCSDPPSEKAAKWIEKGVNKSKYDAEKRRGYLENALDEDDICVEAQFQLGLLEYRKARQDRSPFSAAKDQLRSVHESCNAYAEEVPYTLGTIAYAEDRYEDALRWFDRFLRWQHFTGRPLSPRGLKRVPQVEEALPELTFLRQYNAHSDAPPPAVLTEVSTRDAEYLPALSADGTLLFFTRAGERKSKGDLVSQPYESFTWAKRNGPSALFNSGESLESPFNTGAGYGGASISIDNRSLYLAIKTPNSENSENIDLYSTRYELLEDTGNERVYLWSAPKSLDALNTPDGWESQPAISPDGQTLFFSAVRSGTTPNANGDPSIDILASRFSDGAEWNTPEKLPAPINGPYSDKAPFLHPDGRTLYFASNREPGGGGYDIWMSKLDSAASPFDAGAWSDPVNLGTPLNTSGDEHGLVISSDGTTAYFASRRPGTNGLDILTWTLPEELRPKASVVVKGQLSISDELSQSPIGLELRYAQSKRAQAIDLGDDGAFAAIVDLSTSEDVLLVAKAEGAAFSAGLVIDQEKAQPALVTADLTLRSAQEKNAAFEIQDIHYNSGSATIDRTSLLLLDLFAEYLMETDMMVEIGGHTDNVGSDTDNMALSQSRSKAVRAHLLSQGVPANRVRAKGYGETYPRASNDTSSGRAKNRRTEFKVLSR